MAGSEPEACRIAWGTIVRGGPRQLAQVRGACSYDGQGNRYTWLPNRRIAATRCALDVERIDEPVPYRLGSRFPARSARDFFASWTVAEVLCKLNDVPILLWLRTHGLPAAGGSNPRTVCVGRMRISLTTTTIESGMLLLTCGYVHGETLT